MEQINCGIIKDLLPLYADDVVCNETAELVREHLEHCAGCQKELERVKETITIPIDNTTRPIKSFKKKWNKKKVIIAVSAAVITAVLLIGGFILYCYLTPDIRIAVSKPVNPNAESYIQTPMVSESTMFGLPVPKKTAEQMRIFWQQNNAIISGLYENYVKPIQINTTVEARDGQTIVTYSGTATDKNGDTLPYKEVLTFDFVLTEELS